MPLPFFAPFDEAAMPTMPKMTPSNPARIEKLLTMGTTDTRSATMPSTSDVTAMADTGRPSSGREATGASHPAGF